MSFLPLLAAMAGGGLLGSLGSKSSSWRGSKPELKKFETLNSGQKNLLTNLMKHLNLSQTEATQNPLYQGGQSYLQSILSQDPEMMQQFEAPYMRQFQEEIVPQLAERFSGMGARNSSAFQQTLGAQGAGLMERLASMRAGLGMNAAQMGLGYAQTPFSQQLQRSSLALGTPAFGYQALGGTPGVSQSIFSGAGQGLGTGIGLGMLKLFGG